MAENGKGNATDLSKDKSVNDKCQIKNDLLFRRKMFDEKPKSKEEEKALRWEDITRQVDEIVDALDQPIDPKIKETVIALNALGYMTSGSCEGHKGDDAEQRRGLPWIDMQSGPEPEEKYEGENEIYSEIAAKYGISVEDVKRQRYQQAYEEANQRIWQQPIAEAYNEWGEANKHIAEKASLLLAEYYQGREVDPKVKLTIDSRGWTGRLKNQGYSDLYDVQFGPNGRDLAPGEEEEYVKAHLEDFQKEMEVFGGWLKEEYLTGKESEI